LGWEGEGKKGGKISSWKNIWVKRFHEEKTRGLGKPVVERASITVTHCMDDEHLGAWGGGSSKKETKKKLTR